MFILLYLSSFGQEQSTAFDRYRIHPNWPNQQTAYYKIGMKRDTLKKGWITTEAKGNILIQRVLLKDTIIVSVVDSPVQILSNWKIGELKYTNDSPEKLILNPYVFTNPHDDYLNDKFHLKIPENSSITLTHSFVKWNAITIPFAIRPALNDTIGSKVTADLKIGASFSYNFNWETFKNRRIEIKKSVIGISGGLGFGFSKVTLDKSSTSLSKEPFKNSEDGLALFITPGIGINLKGFQIAGFYGWDIGLTKNVTSWNYNKKPYFGIGLGIDIPTFGK